MSTDISTIETGQTFEDAMCIYLEETLHADVQYGTEKDGEFTVSVLDGETFQLQVAPTADIPGDTLVGGVWVMECEAPTVIVDGEEYTIIRQW